HEAQLDEGPYSVLKKPVIDLVDIREVVNRLAVAILVVNANIVVQNRVEADVLKLGGFLHLAEVGVIVLAQTQHGAPGAEHLLPEVREWMRRRAWIERDGLVRRRRRRSRFNANQAKRCTQDANKPEPFHGC